MAETNGVHAPSPDPLSTNGTDLKRKREDEHVAPLPEADSRNAQTQRDLLEILQQYDTTPSFLDHPITSKDAKERTPKKPRLSEPTTTGTTIASKLATAAYSDLSALSRDADHVRQSLTTNIRAQGKDGGKGRLSVDELKQLQRIQAFEQTIVDVVAQEGKYEAAHGEAAVKQETNGVNHEPESPAVDGAAVLTLFGNAPGPKQLFSSTQRPPLGARHDRIKLELPVEEMSLPNGLTATRIMPLPADERKKVPTFDESFAPPFSLPQLHPPKAIKRSTTRDTTITWEPKDIISRSSRKGGYTTQTLTVGDWLGYGGVDDKQDTAREKRKQRDRALSGGESVEPRPSEQSFADAQAKEEDALFRRAYSTFAPSHDNSRALVPEETRNMIWWQKVGSKQYTNTFAIDPALLDESATDLSDFPKHGAEPEDDNFTRLVEDLDVLDQQSASPSDEDKTNVDNVLREISNLLETLASHQRIRNSTLASTAAVSRTPISPSPALSYRIGRPDSPAEDEVNTYRALRRELAYLILKLPPYAVAKLNGDQLADLGVKKLISFEARDVKGTMEEDQVARMAKYTAMATAAGIASLTRTGSNSSQHYSSTSQRTPAIGQAANTRYGSSAQYGGSRTPGQPQLQRPTSNQSMYGTPSATASRSGYGQQPNQYTRPQAPLGSQSYYRPSNQQTQSSYAGYNQQYNQTASQTPRQSFSSSQPLAQYQQRAQNATAYQSAPQRTASPIKPAGLQPIMAPQRSLSQTYTQQPGSGRATPVSYPSQPQTPVNGATLRPSPMPSVRREGSGTPQPIAPHPVPAQQQAPAPPPQTNGHPAGGFMLHKDLGSSPKSKLPNICVCEVRGKPLRTQATRDVHMKVHQGEKAFVCDVVGCGEDFVSKKILVTHLFKRHGVSLQGIGRKMSLGDGNGVWEDIEDENAED